MINPLYFPRTELANRLLISLKDGITHALTLFAPRRMGKTQFLLNDIKPTAENMGFSVFYFSFMDNVQGEIKAAFINSLMLFLDNATSGKNKFTETLKQIKGVDVLGVGFSLNGEQNAAPITVSGLLNELAEKSKKPILLLLDEVQELARIRGTDDFVRSLRTGLDINQNKIKVIFTGSSTNGLRAMFNDNKAPFFHFAHALDFPNLGREFTDFLANIYHQRTGKEINKAAFYQLFERFHFTPLYMRSIAQDMIINPELTLEQAAEYRLGQMSDLGEMAQIWASLNLLEQQLLILLAGGEGATYSKETRKQLADILGVEDVSASTIQGKLKKLERMELITRSANKTIKINSPHFQTWIVGNVINDKS